MNLTFLSILSVTMVLNQTSIMIDDVFLNRRKANLACYLQIILSCITVSGFIFVDSVYLMFLLDFLVTCLYFYDSCLVEPFSRH